MHQASPLLQAMSCPPLPLWDPVPENNSPERTSPACPLAACASRDQKACSGEPPCRQARPRVEWRGAAVWTPCPVLPPSSGCLVFSTKARSCDLCPQVHGSYFRRWALSRPFSDACTSLPSLTSESSECQVETKPSFQTSLAKNNLVRLEAGHSLHFPSLDMPESSWGHLVIRQRGPSSPQGAALPLSWSGCLWRKAGKT